ncbi:hypothetical protein MC378_08295 [Polaribacter sp. MSW13]|uniref:Heavy metal binding domain-containing protein n=1 Tax=Polaribacter marinus TaxID=2916838 RepID=A0A9X1VMD3_9FLAO|nr:heavy metal-binding domain-containing protein [Polaribacter marinus]MCI2229164.1 hypothetical protein [Polaribacter marinus]
MKKIIIVLAVVFATSIIFTSCKSEKKEVKKEHVDTDKKKVAVKDVYQCPMECEKDKTYDKEGKCPVCEMKLRKKVSESHENHEDHNH